MTPANRACDAVKAFPFQLAARITASRSRPVKEKIQGFSGNSLQAEAAT